MELTQKNSWRQEKKVLVVKNKALWKRDFDSKNSNTYTYNNNLWRIQEKIKLSDFN